MTSSRDPTALAHLLRQTRSLLACHLALGLSSYPAAPGLRQFAAADRAAAQCPVPRPVLPRLAEKSGAAADASSPAMPPESLEGIAKQMAGCRRCALATTPAPGLGGAAPKLLVVGDCLVSAELPAVGLIWGGKEDELFWKMLAAIGLGRETVYVANAVKCPQSRPLAPNDEEAGRSCLFWLEKELLALRPQTICAMGETAAHALIGGKAPIARLRGAFHPCCLPAAGSSAQVLATYHPRFLLTQPEMKAAAWLDLQNLQRRLNALTHA